MEKKKQNMIRKQKPKPSEEETIEELKEKIEIQKHALNKIIKNIRTKNSNHLTTKIIMP